MTRPISSIVIVGGGTAGWLSACLLLAEGSKSAGVPLDVTLIESPDVPTIGVGEGTWPSMRSTLQRIGLPEADLLRRCDASFKQGTRFVGWATGEPGDTYIHPFSLPAEYSTLNLADYWLGLDASDTFADFVSPQADAINAGLAPKQASMPEYSFALNYGYHFDAGRFGRMLHEHAVERLGVNYVAANVTTVTRDANGDIEDVVLDDGTRVAGDLFIDCTGQRALLLGEHLGVDYVPIVRYLLNDAAVAVQVPRKDDTEAIGSATVATAVENGWIWDIGLQSRRGLGHVYSSQHASRDEALARLMDYVTRAAPEANLRELEFRSIPFEPGYRKAFWVGNCVAIGLSAGFVEPLEASALALIEQSATLLTKDLPANRDLMPVVARRFNEKMHYHWERVVEFLKLHYVLNRRVNSAYWEDCRRPESIPESLRDKLRLWEQQAPWHDDAPRVDELFPSASYQYVLYGMGFRPGVRVGRLPDTGTRERLDRVLHEIRLKRQQFRSLLPPNRELLNELTTLPGVA